MTGIDHVGFSVTDFGRALAFYKATLGTLGIKCLTEFEHDGKHHAGFGTDRPWFWIGESNLRSGLVHVAFTAASRSEVESFYSTGLAMGGRDNGKPGLRPHYHPGYFGAFVLDPDGNNMEAVYHGGE